MYIANLEGSLTLTKHGRWLHEGTPVTHERTVALFNRSIVWDAKEQAYFLQIGKGRARFSCEDTAYFVRNIFTDGVPWKLELSDDSIEELRPETLRIGEEHQLYCSVKGEQAARFSRSAYQTVAAEIDDLGRLVIGEEAITIPSEAA